MSGNTRKRKQSQWNDSQPLKLREGHGNIKIVSKKGTNYNEDKENVDPNFLKIYEVTLTTVKQGRRFERQGNIEQAMKEYEFASRLQPHHQGLTEKIKKLSILKNKNVNAKIISSKKQIEMNKKSRMTKALKKRQQIAKRQTLSQENLKKLRKQYQGTKARVRPKEEVALYIQAIGYVQWRFGFDIKSAINAIADCFGSDTGYVQKLWNNYMTQGDIIIFDGRKNREKTVDNIYDLNEESDGKVFELVVAYSYKQNIASKEGFHIRDIKSMLQQHGYLVSESAAAEILREFDFGWTGKDQFYGHNLSDEILSNKKKIFFLKVSQALQLTQGIGTKEKFGISIDDESWGNVKMNVNYTYIHKCDQCDAAKPCWVVQQYRNMSTQNTKLITKINERGKGKRLCFAHHITKYGVMNGYKKDLNAKYLKHINKDTNNEFISHIDKKIV
eukprot:191062_1